MTTTKHESLAAALAAFQLEVPTIAKGNTANAFGGYKYADLTDVTEKVLPLLAKHGLAFAAMPTFDADGRFVLAYSLMHETREELRGSYPLPATGKPQDIGSAITYARRYALTAVTGVAPGGDDDDAAAAQKAATARPGTTPRRSSSEPNGWRKLATDATTLDELLAIHHQAEAEGWLTDDVLKVLSHRKVEITAPAEA